jgi:hypothetical protein
MPNEEYEYHSKRRPFIIFPESGVMFAKPGTALSHNDMLRSLNLNNVNIRHVIDNFPRGYFMNNNLVFYQGDLMQEGTIWQLDKKNIDIIKLYFHDFERIFKINEKTLIYLGVKVGKIGEVWDLLNKVSIDEIKGNSR